MSPDCSVSSSPDLDLVTHVHRCIVARTGRQLLDLQITVVDGAMTVNGVADSFYTKQLVTHAVLREIAGLEFINAVDVRPGGPASAEIDTLRPPLVRRF